MHRRRKIEELNFKIDEDLIGNDNVVAPVHITHRHFDKNKDMVIIIDTREQLPYTFDVPSEVATVPVGDYSIAGLEYRIGIERKELNDLIGCLCKGRERFERELQKARALSYFAVVVEASLDDIAQHRYRSKMLPQAVFQSLMAFSVRYRLPIWFAGNRARARKITQSLLEKFSGEIEKKKKAVQAI